MFVCACRINFYYGAYDSSQFHIVNILLHCLVTCLFVYTLHRVLCVRQFDAGLAGTLFAVLPVHVEAVWKNIILK